MTKAGSKNGRQFFWRRAVHSAFVDGLRYLGFADQQICRECTQLEIRQVVDQHVSDADTTTGQVSID